jgi:oligoribonuclease NrnB/cAMP/cGMP phosphodiesterase (DHH superfamily)
MSELTKEKLDEFKDKALQRRKDEINLIINNLCAGQIFLETMDSVKLTRYYRQDLKNLSNRFCKKLESHIDEGIEAMFDENEKQVQGVLSGMEDLLNIISHLAPEDIVVLRDIAKGLKDGSVRFEEDEKK